MKTFLTLLLMLCLWNVHSQSTITYTVDEDFSTEQTLRSKTSVFDIYPLEDGGFFLGGGFTLLFSNPDSPFIQGLAMIT
jgi:predicted sugar kinase